MKCPLVKCRQKNPLAKPGASTHEWQNRPLETSYPILFLDAMRVKVRDEGLVRNKAIYIALGVHGDGTKDILGIWIENTEGAKFWLRVMNDLKNRGVDDILIAVVDGLKGFPEAINAVFPKAIVQTCIVGSLKNPPFRDSLDRDRDWGSACWVARNGINLSCSFRARSDS